ncbi:MAG: hypothetical protein ACI4AK_02135 [Lepagella sp.]
MKAKKIYINRFVIKVIIFMLTIWHPWMIIEGKEKTKHNITIRYNENSDNSCDIISVHNGSQKRINILIDNKGVAKIEAGEDKYLNKTVKSNVKYQNSEGSPITILTVQNTSSADRVKTNLSNEMDNRPTTIVEESKREKKELRKEATNEKYNDDKLVSNTTDTPIIERINQDAFFGRTAVKIFVEKCDSLSNELSLSEDKQQFIINNNLYAFISDAESEISFKKQDLPTIAQIIITSSKASDSFINLVIETLNNRLISREQALNSLKEKVNNIDQSDQTAHKSKASILNYIIIFVIILILVLWVIIVFLKKRNRGQGQSKIREEESHSTSTSGENNPSIVVRRRTTSILKRQCIDDVINNPEYLAIKSSEFTVNSAISTIYIKNSCIKEVYNLYAEDLRNSENPKEDGCMVLGRWVFNEGDRTYSISLEYVVFPGDDAIFKEYELNFGGKIKLRIAEKLRKLRRETNLQYDLVCWIHSHPGLGVFFSNSDESVQMQLKHSQHPNFLVAFVIDILTSDQEMGIFTFQQDGTMNSKGDITRMYSLEDLYKWALESDKTSFNRENYYNILAEAQTRLASCQGIELNNSSIIDVTQIILDPTIGISGWAIGTIIDSPNGKEYLVSQILKASDNPTSGIIGILITVTHFSLPTIQRLISNENKNINFVMVYSTKLMSLISIPVVNGEIVTDEDYHGDETIDDLKIWTRRKR